MFDTSSAIYHFQSVGQAFEHNSIFSLPHNTFVLQTLVQTDLQIVNTEKDLVLQVPHHVNHLIDK